MYIYICSVCVYIYIYTCLHTCMYYSYVYMQMHDSYDDRLVASSDVYINNCYITNDNHIINTSNDTTVVTNNTPINNTSSRISSSCINNTHLVITILVLITAARNLENN